MRWVPLAWFWWGATKKQRCGSEFAKWHDIYTPEECADEWRQNNADFKWLCHEWFHLRHHVHDGHCTGEFTTVIGRLDSFTVPFRCYVRGESGLRELASVNRRTPQLTRGQFTKNLMPAWFEKWRIWNFDTCLILYLIKITTCFPYWWCTKHAKWSMGK